jgi:phosphatidylglycerophosphate synthase
MSSTASRSVGGSEAPPGGPIGAKKRDYWWTVLAVDPVALPIVRLLTKKRWLTPDQVTMVSLALGLPVGIAYAFGRGGLIVGAVLFYLSFVFDCVDGKLARALHISSPRGQALDQLADGARRASACIGLGFYLWRSDARTSDLLWVVAFGVLSFYFMEISGAEKGEGVGGVAGKWSAALARRRLLPTPGMPDVSALVYIFGPLTEWVVPSLQVGIAMISTAILLTVRRRLR